MAVAIAQQPVPRRRRRLGPESVAGYLFIAIPMVLFLVLQVGAIFYALYVSVWKWNVRSGPVEFVGLQNYVNALNDPNFIRGIQNTIYYAVIWVPFDDGGRPVPGCHS